MNTPGRETVDSLIAPRRDGPGVEGPITAGPAGLYVMFRLWERYRGSVPRQQLRSGVLFFAGAAAGPVTAVTLGVQTGRVGSHDHSQESSNLEAKASEEATLRSPSHMSLPWQLPETRNLAAQPACTLSTIPAPFPLGATHLVHAGHGSLAQPQVLSRLAGLREAG